VRVTLRELRRQRGLTLEALAYLAEVDPATISRVERGLVIPQRHTVVRLARALGISIARLRNMLAEHAVE
jgi:transcriptional regulator with XRE-family HTH domain